MNVTKNAKGQAIPAKTIPLTSKDFDKIDNTAIYWLGNASIFINSRGTNVMIDPLLEGFDMDLLIDMPILPKDIPALDALLITHDDNDHFSKPTCHDVEKVCKEYHAPKFVAGLIKDEGLNGIGHDIGETFSVGDMTFKLTPAEHNWKNESTKHHWRDYKLEDYCGFWIESPDGKIWLPGDSRLLKEHLKMPQPDVILLDFADNSWHITFDGAVKLANTYPDADLICIHWGSVDAPNMNTFNGDPEKLAVAVKNPARVHALAPGEKFILPKK